MDSVEVYEYATVKSDMRLIGDRNHSQITISGLCPTSLVTCEEYLNTHSKGKLLMAYFVSSLSRSDLGRHG